MEGYRGWRIQSIEGKPLLTSYNNSFWEPTMTAKCSHGCEVAFCLENHECGCGLYSRKDLSYLLKEYSQLDIFGVVYNYGVVIEGEVGYRAEKANIRALFTNDFALGAELARWYPGVSISMPPPEIMAVYNARAAREGRSYQYSYEKQQKRREDKKAKDYAFIVAAKGKYPDGPEAEKQRLLLLLRSASRRRVQEFCKAYGSTLEWAERNWVPHPGGSTKAKPGDMVFETNDDFRPLVYINSCRNNSDSASIRWCMDRNGVLVRRSMFERWDANPTLLEARKAAIAEWE